MCVHVPEHFVLLFGYSRIIRQAALTSHVLVRHQFLFPDVLAGYQGSILIRHQAFVQCFETPWEVTII